MPKTPRFCNLNLAFRKNFHFFCIFFRKYLRNSKKSSNFARFFAAEWTYALTRIRKKGNFEAISKGTFINKNQLNKTTKCLQFNN